MKVENSIGWCDETTNGVTGCVKVSPGCKNCYAAVGTRARVLRHRKVNPIETWGVNGQRVPVNFEPVFRRLNKLCICDKCHEAHSIVHLGRRACMVDRCGGHLRRIRLFADSNSDWLDPVWEIDTLANFLDAIRLAPNVDVQLLTKRIEVFDLRLRAVRNYAGGTNADLALWVHEWMNKEATPPKMLGRQAIAGWPAKQGTPPANVWLGVSVEDQKRADERIPLLLQTPAAIRFISAEPLLEALEFSNVTNRKDCVSALGKPALHGIDWVIVGNESGNGRREIPIEHLISVHDQCVNAGVPVYIKQDGALISGFKGRIPDDVWKRKEFPR